MKMTYGRQFLQTSVGSFLKTEPTSAPFDESGRQFMETSVGRFFQTESPSAPIDKFWERDVFGEPDEVVPNDYVEGMRCSFLEYDHGSILPQDLLEKPQGDGANIARTICGGFKVGQTVYAVKQLHGKNEEGTSKDVKAIAQGDQGVVDGMVDGKDGQMRLLFHTCSKGHVLQLGSVQGSVQCQHCGMDIADGEQMWCCSKGECDVKRCGCCRVTYISVKASGEHVSSSKPRVEMGPYKAGDACWCLLQNDDDIPYGQQGEVVGPGNYGHPVKAKFPKGTWCFGFTTLSKTPPHYARAGMHATCVFDVEKYEKDFQVGQVADVVSVDASETITIKLHDTGKQWSLPKSIWTISFKLSEKIEGRYCLGEAVDVDYKGKGKYYPATIRKVRSRGQLYDVKYSDNHKEFKIKASRVRRRK